MKRLAVLMLSVLAVMAWAAPWAMSAPQPKVVPTEWELSFSHQAPQAIQVRVPGEAAPRTFWYMLYSVTNQTGQDRMYVPNFVLYTDTGQVRGGAEGISPTVFEAIVARHNNPLLESVAGMTGMLLRGEDNAKDGVAIFEDIEPEARAFDLFVSGLSGEGVTLKLPRPVDVMEADTEGRTRQVVRDTVVLHKTLRLQFRLPDDPVSRLSRPALADGSDWVMR